MALNQAGTAVGWSKDYLDWRVNYGDPHAVRWDASGTTATELPLPAGSIDDSRAVDINDSGVIVGNVRDYRSGQNYLAVRWNADGSFDELGGLGTDSSGNVTVYAEAINNAGTTVGEAAFYVNGVFKGGRVVRWNANSTTPIEYETLGPDENGYGTGNVTRIRQRRACDRCYLKTAEAALAGPASFRCDGTPRGILHPYLYSLRTIVRQSTSMTRMLSSATRRATRTQEVTQRGVEGEQCDDQSQ